MVRKLEDIADGHHGTVPLHGRMFAQWMHHAFPRECPFPHVAGSTDPQAASDWIEKAGTARASKNRMQKTTDAWAGQLLEDEELTHWTHEDELLVPRTAAPRSSSSSLWGSLRHVISCQPWLLLASELRQPQERRQSRVLRWCVRSSDGGTGDVGACCANKVVTAFTPDPTTNPGLGWEQDDQRLPHG